MSRHRDEAVRALEKMRARLKDAEPLEAFERFQLVAIVEYALSELEQVDERKRARPRAKAERP